jgi:hypothetical protein
MRLASLVRNWFALAATWTLAAGAIVLVQHQVLRQQADEPQVQMAEDAARRLGKGVDALNVLPVGESVPIEASRSPWLAVYDKYGAPLSSSGRFRGSAPRLPRGVFKFAQEYRGHRLSWEPSPGVRQALVIVVLPDAAFVVCGRSLQETELRKRQVLKLMLAVWSAGLAGLLLPSLWLARPNGG